MIPPQIEILAFLGTPVQDDVGVGMITVLMNGDDVVKVAVVILKMFSTHSRGYVPHVFSARPLRIGHEHVCGVAHLWPETIIPTARKSIRKTFDFVAR